MTAYRDFFEILNANNLYDEARHNKSDYTYELNGNLFEFISLDQPQKKRGARRDYLFCNEANELTWEDFFQLLIRTTGKIWVDSTPLMRSIGFTINYSQGMMSPTSSQPTLTIRSWMLQSWRR
jgi:hypothetical protein